MGAASALGRDASILPRCPRLSERTTSERVDRRWAHARFRQPNAALRRRPRDPWSSSQAGRGCAGVSRRSDLRPMRMSAWDELCRRDDPADGGMHLVPYSADLAARQRLSSRCPPHDAGALRHPGGSLTCRASDHGGGRRPGRGPPAPRTQAAFRWPALAGPGDPQVQGLHRRREASLDRAPGRTARRSRVVGGRTAGAWECRGALLRSAEGPHRTHPAAFACCSSHRRKERVSDLPARRPHSRLAETAVAGVVSPTAVDRANSRDDVLGSSHCPRLWVLPRSPELAPGGRQPRGREIHCHRCCEALGKDAR